MYLLIMCQLTGLTHLSLSLVFYLFLSFPLSSSCPDATEEELQEANLCAICREEMTSRCKKLPCNHIFHTSCLRGWFQSQQSCPTCRMDVLNRAALSRMTRPHLRRNLPQNNGGVPPPPAGGPGAGPGYPQAPPHPPPHMMFRPPQMMAPMWPGMMAPPPQPHPLNQQQPPQQGGQGTCTCTCTCRIHANTLYMYICILLLKIVIIINHN